MATADHSPVRIGARLGVLATSVGLALATPTTARAGELRLPSVLETTEQPADPSTEDPSPPLAPADPEDPSPPLAPADPEDPPPPLAPVPEDPTDDSADPELVDSTDSVDPVDPDTASIDTPPPAAVAPPPAPPRLVARRLVVAPEPPPSARQLPAPPKPRRLHILSNGLGIGFTLAGAAAIGTGAYVLTDSVTTTDTGQILKIPGFVLGSTLAVGGSAMLGGGTGILVATAVARDPDKRRPLRHLSYIFLVGAGALASASAYTALDARQQWQDVDPTAPDAYAASNATFNKAAVLAVLAVSQIATFGGIHRATRDPEARPRRYSVRPLPPSVAVTRHGAAATVGFRF